MNYEQVIDEMRAHAVGQGRTHLLRLKETISRAAPELIPHLFWEHITSICNYYFHDNQAIRNIFRNAAESEMDKQRVGI